MSKTEPDLEIRNKLTVTRVEKGGRYGGQKGKGKQRNVNRRLMGMDNVGGLTVGVGRDGVGVSNREKDRTTVTEHQ